MNVPDLEDVLARTAGQGLDQTFASGFEHAAEQQVVDDLAPAVARAPLAGGFRR